MDTRAFQSVRKFRRRDRVAHRHHFGSSVIGDSVLKRTGRQPLVDLFGNSVVDNSERNQGRDDEQARYDPNPVQNLAP